MSGRTLRVVQTLLIVILLLAQEHSPRKSLHAAALACERLLVTGDGACQMRDYKARDFCRGKDALPRGYWSGGASRDVSREFIGPAPSRAILVRLAD